MSTCRFYHPIEVRYGDLDPQGHVNNARYLTYMEQARIAYVAHLGLWKGPSFLDIGIILAANYFDEQKIRTVAARTGAQAVIVPLYVGGAAGAENYFELVDYWVDGLLNAAKKKNLLNSE